MTGNRWQPGRRWRARRWPQGWRGQRSRAVLAGGLVAALAVAGVAIGIRTAVADTGAACAATYSIGWQTPSNSPPDFGATVTVKNNAAYAISTWTITWTFSGRPDASSPGRRTARS